MKQSLKRGASKVVAPSAPARTWASRDFPVPARQSKTAKAEARTSMHFRVLSRTGK